MNNDVYVHIMEKVDNQVLKFFKTIKDNVNNQYRKDKMIKNCENVYNYTFGSPKVFKEEEAGDEPN